MTKKNVLKIAGLALVACTGCSAFAAQTLVDFTKEPANGWRVDSHAKDLTTSEKGFSFTVTGDDPWVIGPMKPMPALPKTTERLTFTLTTEPMNAGNLQWQLFCRGEKTGFNEVQSCRFQPVGDPPYTRFVGEMDASVFPRGQGALRLDPPGKDGNYTVKKIEIDFVLPRWRYEPKPVPPLVIPASTPLVLTGTEWELRHDPDRFGAFRVIVRGKPVENNPSEPLVYQDKAGKVCTLDWETAKMSVTRTGADLVTSVKTTDADGRDWTLTRLFRSVDEGRALTIATTFNCTEKGAPVTAKVFHVPFLTLFIERGSRGHKHQAMLAGVEYLEDEPSSNRKEFRTPEYNRRIVAEYRLSAPLAVFTDPANWLGFAWDRFAEGVEVARPAGPSPIATVFDSPDRLFASGGHLLAFWAPAVGPSRRESSLSIYSPVPLMETTQAVTLRAGKGDDVVSALATLIPPNRLPPSDEVSRGDALELLAHGWLDSSARKGLKVRHACTPTFPYSLAADAAYLMKYLAAQLSRTEPARKALPPRLKDVANQMLAQMNPSQIAHATVSHIRRPAPVLLGGDVTNKVKRAAAETASLARAYAEAKRIWTKPANKNIDLGETLGANHCNGYTSMGVDDLLKRAVWCGDEKAIELALQVVDKLTANYHGTVPRGAQPWEMPLHTPDIMASARLAQLYTYAYMLKPDPAYLREARHWAYSGLSMVYLVPPPLAARPGEKVGLYATCGVMGATHWVAPNWIGRPVQWCGLVYAAALWDLSVMDPQGAYWRKIADGITTSGMRQTHPLSDTENQGLLPDSWNLEKQDRYYCPINPGTVQENFAEHLGLPFYSVRPLARKAGDPRPALLHLAGAVTRLAPKDGAYCCRIEAWPEEPSRAVLTRVEAPRQVTLNGRPLSHAYIASARALILDLPAQAKGELVIK